MYYTNSQVKTTLESWYQTNIGSKQDLAKNVATGDYYCEEAKAKYYDSWTAGSATMTTYNKYTPDFKCSSDGNGKGVVSASVGLLSYDEVVYAGVHINFSGGKNYLYSDYRYWTMSPAGYFNYSSIIWTITPSSMYFYTANSVNIILNPVINIKSDTQISDGDGTKENPFTIQ